MGCVGENTVEGKIITSYATGGVSGQGHSFGGLAGENSGVIAASYAMGSVSAAALLTLAALLGTIAALVLSLPPTLAGQCPAAPTITAVCLGRIKAS